MVDKAFLFVMLPGLILPCTFIVYLTEIVQDKAAIYDIWQVLHIYVQLSPQITRSCLQSSKCKLDHHSCRGQFITKILLLNIFAPCEVFFHKIKQQWICRAFKKTHRGRWQIINNISMTMWYYSFLKHVID